MIPPLFWWLFQPSRINQRGPNAMIGIRTAATLKSPAAWEAAHTRAWPYVQRSSIVLTVLILATLVATIIVPADVQDDVSGLGTIASIIAWFIILLIGASTGQQAARSVAQPSSDRHAS